MADSRPGRPPIPIPVEAARRLGPARQVLTEVERLGGNRGEMAGNLGAALELAMEAATPAPMTPLAGQETRDLFAPGREPELDQRANRLRLIARQSGGDVNRLRELLGQNYLPFVADLRGLAPDQVMTDDQICGEMAAVIAHEFQTDIRRDRQQQNPAAPPPPDLAATARESLVRARALAEHYENKGSIDRGGSERFNQSADQALQDASLLPDGPERDYLLRELDRLRRRAGRIDQDNTGTQRESADALASLAREVKERTGLEINTVPGLLRWLRDEVADYMREHEGSAVNIGEALRSAVGVWPVSLEQILQWIPRSEIASHPELMVDGRPMLPKEFIERFNNEVRILSQSHNRRVKLREVAGDLENEVKVLKAFGTGADFLMVSAQSMEGVKHFLPEYTFQKTDGLYDQATMVVEPTSFADGFKEAKARYSLFRRVWQDEAPIDFKVVRRANGYIDTVYVLGGGIRRRNDANVKDYERSVDGPYLGYKHHDFNGDPRRLVAFLISEGYVPPNPDGSLPEVKLVKHKAFKGVEGKKETWTLPGPKGRDELEKLRDPAQGYGYAISLSGADYQNLAAWGDSNLFTEHDQATNTQYAGVRDRIVLWSGGGNPDDPRYIPGNPAFDEGLYQRARQKGELAEMLAWGLSYSGLVQYLDFTGSGTTGLNLLLQLRRYMSTQRFSGRLGASEELLARFNHWAGTLDMTWHVDDPWNGDKMMLEEGWLRKTDGGGRIWTYEDIDFAGGGRSMVDKDYADGLSFMLEPFHLVRGDGEVDLGRLADSEPGTSAVVINREVVVKLLNVWKQLYLAFVIHNTDNQEIEVLQRKPGIARRLAGNSISLFNRDWGDQILEEYPNIKAMGLSKEVFVDLFREQLRPHYPNKKSPLISVPLTLLGAAVSLATLGGISIDEPRRGTAMTWKDERALREIMNNEMSRLKVDYEGEVFYRGRVLSARELEAILMDVGGGWAAALRRVIQRSK